MLSYCKALAFIPPFVFFHFLSTPSLREGMRRVLSFEWGRTFLPDGTPSLTGRVGVGLWAGASFFRRYSLPHREGWGGSLILILQLLDKNISQA